VIKAYNAFSADIAGGGTRTLTEEKEDMIYDGLRKEGGRLLNCSPDDVAAFNSVSEAINCVAWSLDVSEGKLVSTNIEFPSVTYPALRMAAKNKQVSTVLVGAKNWEIPTDTMLDEIDGFTKAVFITHVENLTGQVHDIKRIARAAHDVGAVVVVDGIQAAGYIPLDMAGLEVDVYITGSYKWLCAPFGTAIAYISKKLYDTIDPVFVGWRTSDEIWDFNAEHITYPSTARKFEYSTSAYGVKLGMVESIKFMIGAGVQKIYDHNMGLDKVLREELGTIKGIDMIDIESHGPIVTFNVKDKDSNIIKRRLQALPRPVELSVRNGLIRVSPHIYNTMDDVVEFLDGVKRAVA
jgi:selenocysteine lyase/cysteine desulfurase